MNILKCTAEQNRVLYRMCKRQDSQCTQTLKQRIVTDLYKILESYRVLLG